MKKLFFISISFILTTGLFAISPFSLENIKSVNVKILDKQKILDEKTYETLTNNVEKKLQEIGMRTQSKNFANLLIKIRSLESDTTTFLHVSLFLVEDVSIYREKETKAIATTYSKDDLFSSTSPKEDVIESIEFLLDEFLSQYIEENN